MSCHLRKSLLMMCMMLLNIIKEPHLVVFMYAMYYNNSFIHSFIHSIIHLLSLPSSQGHRGQLAPIPAEDINSTVSEIIC